MIYVKREERNPMNFRVRMSNKGGFPGTVLFPSRKCGRSVNLFKVTHISDDAAHNEPPGTGCSVIRLAPFTKSLSRLLTL